MSIQLSDHGGVFGGGKKGLDLSKILPKALDKDSLRGTMPEVDVSTTFVTPNAKVNHIEAYKGKLYVSSDESRGLRCYDGDTGSLLYQVQSGLTDSWNKITIDPYREEILVTTRASVAEVKDSSLIRLNLKLEVIGFILLKQIINSTSNTKVLDVIPLPDGRNVILHSTFIYCFPAVTSENQGLSATDAIWTYNLGTPISKGFYWRDYILIAYSSSLQTMRLDGTAYISMGLGSYGTNNLLRISGDRLLTLSSNVYVNRYLMNATNESTPPIVPQTPKNLNSNSSLGNAVSVYQDEDYTYAVNNYGSIEKVLNNNRVWLLPNVFPTASLTADLVTRDESTGDFYLALPGASNLGVTIKRVKEYVKINTGLFPTESSPELTLEDRYSHANWPYPSMAVSKDFIVLRKDAEVRVLDIKTLSLISQFTVDSVDSFNGWTGASGAMDVTLGMTGPLVIIPYNTTKKIRAYHAVTGVLLNTLNLTGAASAIGNQDDGGYHYVMDSSAQFVAYSHVNMQFSVNLYSGLWYFNGGVARFDRTATRVAVPCSEWTGKATYIREYNTNGGFIYAYTVCSTRFTTPSFVYDNDGFLWVFNHDTQTIHKLNKANGTVLVTINHGEAPTPTMAFDSNNLLWVSIASLGRAKVYNIDGTLNREVTFQNLEGGFGIGLPPSNSYVSNKNINGGLLLGFSSSVYRPSTVFTYKNPKPAIHIPYAKQIVVTDGFTRRVVRNGGKINIKAVGAEATYVPLKSIITK